MAENTTPPQAVGSLRVFISWSGERSKVLAQALKEWLPLVLYNVEPWMSEADIAAGGRWEVEIAKELELANFGIACVTRDNVNAPWLLFEAGALAKSLKHSRVIPLLMDLDIKDITGPLARFQAKKMEKVGLSEVIQSINQVANQTVAEVRAAQLFEALWPKLEEKIVAIPKSTSSPKPTRSTSEVMEELVAGFRALETRISEMNGQPRPSKMRKMRFSPMMFEELSHMAGEPGDPIGILLGASILRDDFPWLFEICMDAYRAVKAGDIESVEREAARLRRITEFTVHGPMGEFFEPRSKDDYMMMMELPRMVERSIHRCLEEKKAVTRPRSPRAVPKE